MTYSFGKRSAKNLETCSPELQRVCERALSYGVMDFSVIEGKRSLERQLRLYQQGKSHIDGIERLGKHNHDPSQAVDLLPYPKTINDVDVWKDKRRFSVLAGLMLAAAHEEGVELRWGGDWDGDGNNKDSKLDDLPHFETVI